MKCKVHNFAANGKCLACGKRRPGRPKNPQRAPNSSPAPAAETHDGTPTVPPLPVDIGTADRAARLRSLFAPPPLPAPPPAEPDPEPKRKQTVTGEKEDWAWVASVATEGIDVGAGWAIAAWTDLEPMEASASSRKRFAEKLGVFAEQRLGAVEVPTWIVLLICLVALVASKVVGAPKKAEKLAAAPTASTAPSASAPTAAMPIADSVPVAASPAIVPLPQPSRQPTIVGDGNAESALLGY